MSEKLTDKELALAERLGSADYWGEDGPAAASRMLLAMASELRAARAKLAAVELSGEERDALDFARNCVETAFAEAERSADDGCAPSPVWPDRAVAVLSKLLGEG